jgi:cyclic di-GMP phosphodiesterase
LDQEPESGRRHIENNLKIEKVESPLEPSPLPIHAQKILVVDDEESVVRLIARVLERHGYKDVLTATDSSRVMELVHSFQPDLVLLDLNMPKVSGFELLEQIHREVIDFEPIPVVVLSGERARVSRMEALKLGASDYIVKPFDLEALARLKNNLERRLLGKQVHAQKMELEERVRERTRELEEAQLETVFRLGLASEYRDDDTGAHVVRMALYVTALALASGQDKMQAELTGLAAKLHDIGKLGIPDSILLKPGRLTPEEFDVIKTHTLVGAKILSGAKTELLQLAEVIALNHHEKWDGSGYPNGLKGSEIPRVARMVAVCDVFDALTSARPYKEAWSIERAFDLLKAESGKHFDPDMVDLFFQQEVAILAIKASSGL